MWRVTQREDEMNKEADWEGLKRALNTAVIMYAPSCLTIAEAEDAMLLMVAKLAEYERNHMVQPQRGER